MTGKQYDKYFMYLKENATIIMHIIILSSIICNV
jgi:hypothetical protein